MIETEVYDDTDTREVHWDLRPVHFSDAGWQYGKVDIRRSDPYKIIITTERNDRGITGYVAIDDFEFKLSAISWLCRITCPISGKFKGKFSFHDLIRYKYHDYSDSPHSSHDATSETSLNS